MPKIRVTLSTGFAGATHEDVIEIDDQEWNECNDKLEQNKLLDEMWEEWAWNFIEGGLELIDENEESE